MHGDEPDNAQRPRDGRRGWDPPIPPEKIVADYERMTATDSTRPVLLNLYPEVVEAVKKVNAEVTSLAAVINSPTVADAVEVSGEVTALRKRRGEDTYVFAVSRLEKPGRATFTFKSPIRAVERIGDGSSVPVEGGRFGDEFPAYGVGLYRIRR